jgi:hypothetical protein
VSAPTQSHLVQGPLTRQPQDCAALAGAFVSAAEALWDAATLDDPAQMWEDGRAAASWAIAACDRTAPTLRRKPPAQTQPQATGTAANSGLFPASELGLALSDPG